MVVVGRGLVGGFVSNEGQQVQLPVEGMLAPCCANSYQTGHTLLFVRAVLSALSATSRSCSLTPYVPSLHLSHSLTPSPYVSHKLSHKQAGEVQAAAASTVVRRATWHVTAPTLLYRLVVVVVVALPTAT